MVLQCNTEEESVELVSKLKPTEAALLNWAVDLMADVVEEEESNKMNARNIAMVFAPNMTQMSDPLTALMHAVQVMNLLKTLIMKTLREREEATIGGYSPMSSHSCDGPTDEDFDSQQEMDTSSELRGPTSDYDNALYSNYSGDEDEDEDEDGVESLGEIEECFLRQLDGNKNVSNRFSGQSAEQLQRNHASPRTRRYSGCNVESGISFTDSKNENSALSTSDGEDSGVSNGLQAPDHELCSKSLAEACENTEDAEMVDEEVVESTRPNDQLSLSVAG
ncbi:hypothetical protein CCACVL1_14785 [Corchorus capsularis]|uniref:Rho-GAP domain-containing protein n=1 Tax=Corchorus capsularis TaxID=210143 RepID=A0A1R3I5I4_COCAP|nr:hypothetical protein CCACVL1_14785 [Corchorus capsularis]